MNSLATRGRARGLLRRLLSTSTRSPLEEATAQWNKGLKLAEQNDPAALCDIGWGYHQGTNPQHLQSLDTAMEYYVKSATLGYSPAASLLADIHYYEHDNKKDWGLAQKYLQEVIALTDPEEAGDAYVLAKSLQKKGMIECHGIDHDGVGEHIGPDRGQGMNTFQQALDICSTHLNGSYPFLLAHDPPGLFEQLEHEQKLLSNEEVLGRVMSELVSVSQGESGDGSALSQLQYYTRDLRVLENNPEWVLKLTENVLDTFPATDGGGDWGVTYFASSLRIFMEPVVQHCVSRGHGPHGQVPKMVGLGSALGNTVVWPALAFGFRGICFDILSSCTEGASELYHKAADAIARKNTVLKEYKGDDEHGGGGSEVGAVTFETLDVVQEVDRVAEECKDANVVWINDFSWPVEAQQIIEQTAYNNMPSNSVMVLYRAPHVATNEKTMTKINVATSWNPNLEMHVVLKV
jgi:tetratricopeptide (TPR) repeat protein